MSVVMIVEDDAAIAAGLRIHLAREGYQVRHAATGPEALVMLRVSEPDLLLLDVMLPGMNGFEVLRAMRAEGREVPVIVLSARGGEDDKVLGLELGAVDYVAKPFGVRELLARVKAALRRVPVSAPVPWGFADVVVSPVSRTVMRAGQWVELTLTEWELLSHLGRHAEVALTRDEILRAVWGSAPQVTRRTVDNFVAQLRAQLEARPEAPQHLQTVRGVGYRLLGVNAPAFAKKMG